MADTPTTPAGTVTLLLRRFGDGDRDALDQLMPMLYTDLKRLAQRQLRREHHRSTLDTGGLVHEAYFKLIDSEKAQPRDRAHFLALCGRAMRQVVIDQARRRNAAKRGGVERPVTLDENFAANQLRIDEALAIDAALERLARHDPRLVQVVECRFFAGLTEDETATALGLTSRTVQRDWRRARAWLLLDLGGTAEPGREP